MKKIHKQILKESDRLTGLSGPGYTYIYKDHHGLDNTQVVFKNYVL